MSVRLWLLVEWKMWTQTRCSPLVWLQLADWKWWKQLVEDSKSRRMDHPREEHADGCQLGEQRKAGLDTTR